MTSLAAPARRIWPSIWGAMLRDRLQFFRLLTLVLALLASWGVAAAVAIQPAPDTSATTAALAVLLLTMLWVWGFRTDGLPRSLLPVEAALLAVFAFSIQSTFAAFGVMYVGLQHRALFGGRRDAVVIAVVYGVTLVADYTLLPGGLGAIRPLLVVELATGGFGAYLMHTLAEVLARDHARKQALRESEQRFRAVIENLREALLITDLEDRIVLANQRVRDVLGYEPAELTGRIASELLLPEDHQEAFRQRMAERVRGDTELYEAELIRKDGSRIFAEVSAAPYRDASGQVVGTLGAISDISNRKRLAQRLRQAMRMEAVGQLAGGVAHDFNNLLTVIKCNTELLLADLPVADTNRESVAEIVRSVDRGAMLTHRLLAFSRRQLLQPRRIRLGDVVEACVEDLRALLRHGVVLTTTRDEGTELIFADPMQVEQALSALVRNSNDAMPDGGGIAIATRVADVDAASPPVLNQDMPGGRYVVLSVADTGRGMDGDVLAHVFEPFVTTKGPGEGSGLGLASVYGTVRQSGGYVAVDSAPGAGTSFEMYFPALREPAPPTPPTMSTRRAPEPTMTRR